MREAGWDDLHLLFDLDDTLYPASSGLFPLVSARIHRFIQDHLACDASEARRLQSEYWRRYGTSLHGLMRCHGIEPEPFLEYVHDVPVEDCLERDEKLRSLLHSLPGHRHVFTNGPSFYADRVLRALGIEDLFENIFDIRAFGYVPKPNAAPYERVMDDLPGHDVTRILIEDAPKNLPPARDRGWFTIWLRSRDSVLGGSPGLSMASAPEFEADAVLDHLDELPQALSLLLRRNR